MVDGLAVAREPRGPVEQPAQPHRGPRRRAQVRQLAPALGALARTRAPRRARHGRRRRRGARPGRSPRRRRRPRGRARPDSEPGRCPRSRSGRSGRCRSRAGARAPPPARGRELELGETSARRPSPRAPSRRSASGDCLLLLPPCPAGGAAPRPGCDSASGDRPRPRAAAAPRRGTGRRACGGSACGRRSRWAARRRWGSRRRA